MPPRSTLNGKEALKVPSRGPSPNPGLGGGLSSSRHSGQTHTHEEAAALPERLAACDALEAPRDVRAAV